jgi:hypothetical protein
MSNGSNQTMSSNDQKMLAQLKQLRGEIDALLTSIPDRLDAFEGLKVKLGACSYSPEGSFTFKIQGTLPGGTDREASAYPMLSQQVYNDDYSAKLPMPSLNDVLHIGGVAVTVVGARPRTKYNVTVQRLSDGTRVRYKAKDIARIWAQLKAKEAAIAAAEKE